MEYLIDDKKFSLSYQELKDHYHRFCQMSDEEFMQNLPAAAHLACVICYMKEVPSYVCLSDLGVVHQLIHLIHIPDANGTSTMREIRQQFELWLKLA